VLLGPIFKSCLVESVVLFRLDFIICGKLILSMNFIKSQEPRMMYERQMEGVARGWLAANIADQPNHDQMIRDAVERHLGLVNTPEAEAERLAKRIVERTFHPSQILPIKLKQLIWAKLREIKKRHRQSGFTWDEDKILNTAQEAVDDIFTNHDLWPEVSDLSTAKIAANTKLNPESVDYIKNEIIGKFAEFKETGDFNEIMFEYLDAKLGNRFARRGNEESFVDGQKASESWEMLVEAKIMLLTGASDIFPSWVDFDGAKRPQGIMFTRFGELLMDDIRVGYEYLNKPEKSRLNKVFTAFYKVDVLIHALTQLLQENGEGMREVLEDFMNFLKERRKSILNDLVKFRNRIEVNMRAAREEDGDEHGQIFLSKQVRFMPRLDRKFVDAALKSERGEELSVEELGYLRTYEAIEQQIVDANEISTSRTTFSYSAGGEVEMEDLAKFAPVVPQIMLANAGAREGRKSTGQDAFEDMDLIDRRLEKLGVNAENVKLVPLFESEETTSRTYIREYLECMWHKFGEDLDAFNKRVNEVFFAGSDLSKEIGSFAALIQVCEAAKEIIEFNKEKATDIRVKLGSGESLFRQMGFLDDRAGEPIIDFEGMTSEEEEEARELFGDDYESVLRRKPTGFHFLLQRHPWINSFTMQSRARERGFSIEPSKLVELFKDLEELHEENKKKADEETPSFLTKAAEASKIAYQQVMGSPDEPSKPLISLPTLIEVLIKSPEVRDRATSRDKKKRTILEELDHLSKSGISARAIGTTTASNFVFPLGLLDKAAVLQYGKDNNCFEELLYYLPLDELIREVAAFNEIAEDVFEMMVENGFGDIAEGLRVIWYKLNELVREGYLEYWCQTLGDDISQEKADFLNKLAGMDFGLEREKTELYRKNYDNIKPVIKRAMNHLGDLDNFSTVLNDSVQKLMKTDEIAEIIDGIRFETVVAGIDDLEGIESDEIDNEDIIELSDDEIVSDGRDLVRQSAREIILNELEGRKTIFVEEGEDVLILRLRGDERRKLLEAYKGYINNPSAHLFELEDQERKAWNQALMIGGYVRSALG
jgi:hypothetical protein